MPEMDTDGELIASVEETKRHAIQPEDILAIFAIITFYVRNSNIMTNHSSRTTLHSAS